MTGRNDSRPGEPASAESRRAPQPRPFVDVLYAEVELARLNRVPAEQRTEAEERRRWMLARLIDP